MGRKILKVLFWVLIFALLVLPLGLINQISTAEMEEYSPADSPVIRQSAIGTPVQAVRTDLKLYVTVSGTFTSADVAFMELPYEEPYSIRWIISHGDEIQNGQVLGYYNGEEVISTVDGIVRTISTSGANAYIMVACFSPLVLECTVQEDVLDSLKQFRDSLTLSDGSKVTLSYVAKAKNHDGSTNIRLILEREGDAYGTVAENLLVYLGGGYPNVLVLPANCVYQKNDGLWYARQVTEDGLLIGERQVSVSYSNGSVAIVGGIEEGQWFDSGYKG